MRIGLAPLLLALELLLEVEDCFALCDAECVRLARGVFDEEAD